MDTKYTRGQDEHTEYRGENGEKRIQNTKYRIENTEYRVEGRGKRKEERVHELLVHKTQVKTPTSLLQQISFHLLLFSPMALTQE